MPASSIGAELALRTAASVTTLSLALALQFFTFPVGANLIARAVYRRQSDDVLGGSDESRPSDIDVKFPRLPRRRQL